MYNEILANGKCRLTKSQKFFISKNRNPIFTPKEKKKITNPGVLTSLKLITIVLRHKLLSDLKCTKG